MPPDPNNPYAPGAANPYVVNQGDATSTPTPTPGNEVGINDNDLDGSVPNTQTPGMTPVTTKPRQMPSGAPAPGSMRDQEMGVQQGFANLQVRVACGNCGAQGRGPLRTIAAQRCGRCGSNDIGFADEIDKVSAKNVVTLRDVEEVAPHLDAEQRSWVYETIVRGARGGVASDNPEFQKVVRDARTMPVSEASKIATAGYYVLRQGMPIVGPFPTASDAHQKVAENDGDAVEYLSHAGKTPDEDDDEKPTLYLHAKIARIAEAILTSNPGMERGLALSLAQRTAKRYPAVLGATRTFDYQAVLRQIGTMELMNVGARDYLTDNANGSLQFTIGMGRPKTKAIVTLDPDDTYTLEIGHSDRDFNWVSDYRESNVYGDVLGQVLHYAWNGVMEKRRG